MSWPHKLARSSAFTRATARYVCLPIATPTWGVVLEVPKPCRVMVGSEVGSADGDAVDERAVAKWSGGGSRNIRSVVVSRRIGAFRMRPPTPPAMAVVSVPLVRVSMC